DRIGLKTRFSHCVLAEIGKCAAPCEGKVTPEDYGRDVAPASDALLGDPSGVLHALELRMERLVAAERFEEAATTRDRIDALVSASAKRRAVEALARAGRLVIDDGGATLEMSDGVLERVDGEPLAVPPDGHPDETRLIAGWLGRARRRIRLLGASGEWSESSGGGHAIATWQRRIALARRDPAA
ncbi:MAG TPA: UvrB/UvrC motif-containing protein, partial [Actinomycetota bacterium]|nr:UvrB/UvrC motif-containing protein [Actinomycetota bacterium]